MNDFRNSPNRLNRPHYLASAAEYWWAIAALLFVFWLFHPDLFLLKESPMYGDLWSNKDPTVSWSAYMPGLREFRYELFENGNILWSPHRGLGQPIFGNGIQGAPLFPLTLAQLWLPDQQFWSINPMSRIFITAVMLFLCARNLFRLPWVPSMMFAILAAYNINVFRWINHPWTNGLLAGAWYLYFLVQVSLPSNYSKWRQVAHIVGLFLGVIGMVTNGFPEASAVFAFIVVFIYPAVMAAHWQKLKGNFSLVAFRLVTTHVLAFALISVQMFGLVEYVNYTQVLGLRDGISGNAFKPEDIAPYLNSQLSIFWRTDAQRDYISFTIGIIGGFLALQGLLSLILDRKNHGKVATSVGIGFLLCMGLFTVKAFGMSPIVEWIFSKTPVLDVSHFPLYFPPMFFFGTAYLAALAVASYRFEPSPKSSYHGIKLVWATLSLIALVLAIKSVINSLSFMGAREFWLMHLKGEGFNFVWFFLIIAFGVICFHAIHAMKIKKLARLFPSAVVGTLACVIGLIGVTIEQKHTVKANFVDIDAHRLFRSQEEWDAIDIAVEKSGLSRHELRTRDESGDYIQHGLGTIDNGASAMLPAELRLVRRALFDAPYGGYIPLRKAYFDWSGWLLSNNLITIHSTTFSTPSWEDYQATTELAPEPIGEANIELTRENPVFIAGWVSSKTQPQHTQVWAKFEDDDTRRWMLTNDGGKRPKVIDGEMVTSSLWRMRLPIHELPSSKYTITLRVLDTLNGKYQDSQPLELSLIKRENELEKQGVLKTPADRLLVQYESGSRSIYYDNNALPRAFIASSCQRHTKETETLDLLKTGIPVLRGKIGINSGNSIPCESYQQTFKRVAIIEDNGSSMSFEDITGPALLFVNDSYYPGWQAQDAISKEPLDIERANVAMRAVYLPEQKTYQVQMNYQPSWMIWAKLGAFMSIVCLVWLLIKIVRGNSISSRRDEQL